MEDRFGEYLNTVSITSVFKEPLITQPNMSQLLSKLLEKPSSVSPTL